MLRYAKRLARWAAYAIPFLLLKALGVRIVSLTHPERIGHLCVEPDCLIKEGALGMRPKFRPVLLLPSSRVANPALANLWKRHLSVVSSEIWCRQLERLGRLRGLSYSVEHYAVAIDRTARGPEIYAKWGTRPPILALASEQLARGRKALQRLGLPEDTWFVCVHSRGGGYSPSDEHLHSFRNSVIDSYKLAMDAIIRAGGWCVRVGEASAQVPERRNGVIDYAHSDAKSDWMDVYLCADCRFFLGNTSGLYAVANAFGKRSALANMIPVSVVFPFGARDIGMPKLLRRTSDGALLHFTEILRSPIANFRFAAQYERERILVVDNDPEEIRDLAIEMLESIEGTVSYTESDKALQDRFRSLMRPGHYSYGAASRVGRDFLRKYASLLDEQ